MTNETKAPGAAESAETSPPEASPVTDQSLDDYAAALRAHARSISTDCTGPKKWDKMRLKLSEQTFMLDRLFAMVLEKSRLEKAEINVERLRLALQSQRQYRQTVLTLRSLKKSGDELSRDNIAMDSYSPEEIDYVLENAHRLTKSSHPDESQDP